MPLWFWVSITAVVSVSILTGAVFGLRALLYRLTDRRMGAYQNDLVARHLEEVRNLYHEMRGWRHDYHNHIQTLKAYRKLGENEKIDEYLTKLDTDLTEVDTVIKSGNVMTDAIINSKLSLAKNRNIGIHAKAVVPGDLHLSEIDLCVIIGNLLDNAMEAALTHPDEASRKLRLYIDVKRGHLYISVTNTYSGRAAKQNGRYVSVKEGAHGFGLNRVDRLVNKYGGYITRRDEEGAFTTEVMLPL